TKWTCQVTHPWRIPEMLGLAVAHATTGVPGPVCLEIPIDVLFDEAAAAEVRMPSFALPATSAGAPTETIDATARLMANAERPLVLVGGGVTFAHAQEDLRALSTALDLP